MISLEQYNARLKAAVAAYPLMQRTVATRTGLNALALVKARVIGVGKDETGNSYNDYSITQLPSYYFKGRTRAEINAGGPKQYVGGNSPIYDDFISDGDLSYEAWRKANNLQTDHRDFFFSGQMWKDVKVKLERVTGTGAYAIVRIAPTSIDQIKKWEWNTARDGEILALAPKEEKVLAQAHKQDVIDHYNRIFKI